MLDIENIVDTQSEAEELEEVVMGLIINSGQARSLAYGALKIIKTLVVRSQRDKDKVSTF